MTNWIGFFALFTSAFTTQSGDLLPFIPLLGESGFALHRPHPQALALSAECYLSNGYLTIYQFREGYMDLKLNSEIKLNLEMF